MEKRNYEYTSYDLKIGMWILVIGISLGITLYHAILTSQFSLMSFFPIAVSSIFIYINHKNKQEVKLTCPEL